VDDLKDENEQYRKMVMESIEKIMGGLGAADVDSRLEEQLIDGILYAFQVREFFTKFFYSVKNLIFAHEQFLEIKIVNHRNWHKDLFKIKKVQEYLFAFCSPTDLIKQYLVNPHKLYFLILILLRLFGLYLCYFKL